VRDFSTRFDALLAVNPLRSMGAGFRGSHARFGMDEAITGLAILAGVVVATLLLTHLLTREERLRRTNDPWSLFRSLCRAHRLQRVQVRLLHRVARAQQVDHPARLFLEPERYQIGCDDPQFGRDRAMLAQIASRLFAGLDARLPSEQPGPARRPADPT